MRTHTLQSELNWRGTGASLEAMPAWRTADVGQTRRQEILPGPGGPLYLSRAGQYLTITDASENGQLAVFRYRRR